jgi:uncharacterized protein (DUF2235 family)
MALYAFDGTWNSAKDNEDPTYENTNVYRFFQAYHKHSNTDDFYVAGVGTRFDLVGKIAGGVFGLGVLPRIDEAYAHLCHAWAGGDTVIDIVGFSRGAATTLDFCHRIQAAGIRHPGSDEVVEAQPTIRFLGVWDVVAAFGLANLGNTELNIGHHLELPKSSLRYAFHAMALDERRLSFLPTRLHGACEVWFRGAHSDIGGGDGNRGLNDITLKWMLSKAKGASLPIADEDIAALRPDPTAAPMGDPKLKFNVRVISAVDRYHYTVSPLAAWTNPPTTCTVETPADEQRATELGAEGVEVLPMEARRRLLALWETAVAVAAQQDFTLDAVRDPLLMLLHGRISLVTNDQELQTAGHAVARLVTTMIEGAQQRGFHVLAEFFLTEALSQLPRLFPLTD